jgi:hypothetical protein
MTIRRQRPANSAFVREVHHVCYEDDAADASVPGGGWDLDFMSALASAKSFT